MSPRTLFASTLIGVLSLSPLTPVASAAASFSDVPSTHPNAEAIAYVKAEGIVDGYADGTYKPNQTINRAEFTKIILEATQERASCASASKTFSDVQSDAWFSAYVCRGKELGVIGGYSDGTFRPSSAINFAEAAKIIAQAQGLSISVDASVWYRGSVEALAEHHAIPVSIDSFEKKFTRGEMAEMIWRLKAGINDKPSQTYEALVHDTPQHEAKRSVDYVLQYRHESDPDARDPWDASIVRKDRGNNRETVVVESIKKLLPELGDNEVHTLFPFAQPSDALAIFQGVHAETDGGGGPLYAFNPAKGTIRKMRVNNDVFKGGPGQLGSKSSLSKNQSTLAWVPDSDPKGHEKVMYLIDLVNDSSRVLVQLQGNETFDAADFAGGIGSQHTDISWLDNKTILYAVYDQSKKPASTFDGKNILIEYRRVELRQ